MSLIKCKECGKKISSKSNQCVHCGYTINAKDYENVVSKKKPIKAITLGVIVLFILMIIILQIPKWINQNKFKKIFDDTSILTSGYTSSGLTYLWLYPNSFTMEYTEYVDGSRDEHADGSEVEINGSVKFENSNTLLLTYDEGSITCSILAINVLDCDGAVFRRYDGSYGDEEECQLDFSEREPIIAAGFNDVYYGNKLGASYNNPYEKTDTCYQAYDSNYHTGVYNGYERSKRTNDAYEEALKGNGCLGLGGQCYNPGR